MINLFYILLGMIIWQGVIFITIVVTNEDEDKVYSVGIGFWWLPYWITRLILNTFIFSKKAQARILEKTAKKELKKKVKNWEKWYNRYKNFSDDAWKNFKNKNADLLPKMEESGFKHFNRFSLL